MCAITSQGVLQRYPNNGKLLRCYGRFLEDLYNDPPAAAKCYAQAMHHGAANAMEGLGIDLHEGKRPDFMSQADLRSDAVVIINAEGTMLMSNDVGVYCRSSVSASCPEDCEQASSLS